MHNLHLQICAHISQQLIKVTETFEQAVSLQTVVFSQYAHMELSQYFNYDFSKAVVEGHQLPLYCAADIWSPPKSIG